MKKAKEESDKANALKEAKEAEVEAQNGVQMVETNLKIVTQEVE